MICKWDREFCRPMRKSLQWSGSAVQNLRVRGKDLRTKHAVLTFCADSDLFWVNGCSLLQHLQLSIVYEGQTTDLSRTNFLPQGCANVLAS